MTVMGFVEGLSQAGKIRWFTVVMVKVRMEKVKAFCVSCPIRIKWGDGGKKAGGEQVPFLGQLGHHPLQSPGAEGAVLCNHELKTDCRGSQFAGFVGTRGVLVRVCWAKGVNASKKGGLRGRGTRRSGPCFPLCG